MERTGYPHPSSAAVTSVMRGNRKVDTRPELQLRSALHAAGERFRKHLLVEAAGVRVRPDIVFPARKVAVFVDGCFWHGCPQHGTRPSANSAYWSAKLARNRARDSRVNDALESAGWRVVRVWEHVPATQAAATVAECMTSQAESNGATR
jgi:DNA mismatch endonuclease (patch repair protein)